MELKLRRYEDVFILDVIGDLDLYNAPALKEMFVKLLEKKITRFVINMERVDYLDSSGVGSLLNIYALVKQKGLDFFLSNVHGTVQKVLTLTRLQGYFPETASAEEAVKKIVAGREKGGRQ